MMSVNVAPNQLYYKENDGAIKCHNLDTCIRVALYFVYEYR